MGEVVNPSRRSSSKGRLMLMEGLLILATVFVVGSLLYMLLR